jgi:hypothetical protein
VLDRKQQISTAQSTTEATGTAPPARPLAEAGRFEGIGLMNDKLNQKMTLAEFEERLPEFFATGTGHVSDDPRFQTFLKDNPDSAALVRDLEYIAEHARLLLEPAEDVEPSEQVWNNIQSKLNAETGHSATLPGSEPETHK